MVLVWCDVPSTSVFEGFEALFYFNFMMGFWVFYLLDFLMLAMLGCKMFNSTTDLARIFLAFIRSFAFSS